MVHKTSVGETLSRGATVKEKEHQAQAIHEILERFDDDRKIQHLNAYEVSEGISLDEAFMLIPRLERAAINQINDGSATVSRYVIWAETVRGILLSAEADVAEGNLTGDTLRKLRKCINALSAFSEIQQIFELR
jgi:hypothetical protein